METVHLIFYLLAGISLAGAFGVILHPHPIGSAISLIITLFSSAGLFVLMHAHFLAVLQVLVYVGAIMVLFIFVIMLMEFDPSRPPRSFSYKLWCGLSIVTALVFGVSLVKAFFQSSIIVPAIERFQGFGHIDNIASLMFGPYMVGFEVLSLLLLVAVLGCVLMTVGER